MFNWFASPIYAQFKKKWEGMVEEEIAGKVEKFPTFKSLETVFFNILTIATTLAGIAVFIMLIYGGFSYLISGGDPEKVKKSTSILTWAIVGLIILIAVWFIFRFIEEFTGVTITQFEIPGP